MARRDNRNPDEGKTPASAVADGPSQSVTVRFYCQGIGDCHLLRFKKDGRDFWVMIDCGIHSSIKNGAKTIDKIVDDIACLTGKRLDVVVLTHEHWDHNSAFKTAESKFRDFQIDEIWMGWTENPHDRQALEFDKFKETAADALTGAQRRLDNLKRDELTPHLSAIKGGLEHLLGFTLGVKGQRVRDARKAAVGRLRGAAKPKYFDPATPPFEVVPGIRVYVLGPPRDQKMFGITERAGEMYGIGPPHTSAMVRALADPLEIADRKSDAKWWDDFASPFDPNVGFRFSEILKRAGGHAKKPAMDRRNEESRRHKVTRFLRNTYVARATSVVSTEWRGARGRVRKLNARSASQSWRRIDNDWLGMSADLGIQLDRRTNNSSLVLAFEFMTSRRVMLFVGDAQIGNWMSWEKVHWTVGRKSVTARDLLARTVFYKVGHHGSQNATRKQNGLELMIDPRLSAFIPTNWDDAQKVRWGAMPFDKLLDALRKKTQNRVVRADDKWVRNKASPPAGLTSGSGAILGIRHDKENGLWVEMDIG